MALFGLTNLNNIANNIGLAAELQSAKLVVESASDIAKYQKDNKVKAADIKTSMQLLRTLQAIE